MNSDVAELFRWLLLWLLKFVPIPGWVFDSDDERSPSEIADPPQHIIEEENFKLAYDFIRLNGDVSGYTISLNDPRWMEAGFLSSYKTSVRLTTPSGVAYQSLPGILGVSWQRLHPPHTKGRPVPEAKLDLLASFLVDPLPGGGKGIPDLVAMFVFILVVMWFFGLRPAIQQSLGLPSPPVVEEVSSPPPRVHSLQRPPDEVFIIPDVPSDNIHTQPTSSTNH